MPSFSALRSSAGAESPASQRSASSAAVTICGCSSSNGALTARVNRSTSSLEPPALSSRRLIASSLKPSACSSRISSIRASWSGP